MPSKKPSLMYLQHFETVRRGGMNLRLVPDVYLDAGICLAAVKNDGLALQYVPERLASIEICLTAVRGNARALAFVPEKLRTDEVREAALKGMNFSGEGILLVADISAGMIRRDPKTARKIVENACAGAMERNPLAGTAGGRRLVMAALPASKAAAAWGTAMKEDPGLLEQDGMRPPSWLESYDFYDELVRQVPSLRGIPEEYADEGLCLEILDAAVRQNDPAAALHLLQDIDGLVVTPSGEVLEKIIEACSDERFAGSLKEEMKAEIARWLDPDVAWHFPELGRFAEHFAPAGNLAAAPA